ncbi:lipopolysaccharide heptosyltransferase family protein, partial [Shigella sonnei]
MTSREARLGMFLASLLRRIAFSYYDYKAYNFNIEKTDFVVIHIP